MKLRSFGRDMCICAILCIYAARMFMLFVCLCGWGRFHLAVTRNDDSDLAL